jgi:hypothetical protein
LSEKDDGLFDRLSAEGRFFDGLGTEGRFFDGLSAEGRSFSTDGSGARWSFVF